MSRAIIACIMLFSLTVMTYDDTKTASNADLANRLATGYIKKSDSWLATRISKRYTKTDPTVAAAVAIAAKQYQRVDFPKAEDIVAIVAIESMFDPLATSKLKTDPAKGLMQIRHIVWKHKINNEDMTNVDNQIKHGADILAHYYALTNDRDQAIMAYNVGITAVRKGRKNEKYLHKYYRELKAFTNA